MIKIDLPLEYNSKQIKEAISAQYPDLEVRVKPARMFIRGSGDNATLEPAELIIKGPISPSEKAEIESNSKQILFDLPTEKTDAEEKKEELLKELLSGPAFVYILKELDDLKKEIRKLKKETTKGETKNEPIPESPQEPRESADI